MCVNQRLIINIYTKKEFYVKCGKCPACLQEKAAHRVSRIKATESDSLEVLMVSLTYRRGDVPYIDRKEAYEFSRGKRTHLNVYRDCIYRKVRVAADYTQQYKRYETPRNILQTIDYYCHSDFRHCKDLKYEPGKIGIAYYPDVQRFIARLRLNLKRLYNYEKPFKTFICSEYGSKSHRPHMHILLFCNKGDSATLRSAIIASWPFSNLSLFPRAIEKSFRGASYVASYVNSGSDFPTFIRKFFPPKHSYSKGFGLNRSVFTLSSILEHFRKGTLAFSVLRNEQGIPNVSYVPYPSYVIHRYFPKFKGYNRISPSSICEVMRGIYNFDYAKVKSILDSQAIYYSEKEFNQFSVMLNNAYKRFVDNSPKLVNSYGVDVAPLDVSNFGSYARLHRQIWNLHASTILMLHLTNDDIPLNEKYDNLDYVKYKRDIGKCPPGFEHVDLSITNPNEFKSNIRLTAQFEQSFNDNIKHRSVSNAIMSQEFDEW